MGDPAAKATDSANMAAQELEYVLRVLERDPSDIYQSGRMSICRCRQILSRLPNFDDNGESQVGIYEQS